MRVMIDTNVLISASLGFGTPYQAYTKAVTTPCHGMVCDQIIDEMRRVYNRKFPDRLLRFQQFLAMALTVLEIIPTPVIGDDEALQVRDPKERPILQAAIFAKADVLLTGDKDFLESGISDLRIMTAAEFLQL